MNACSKFTRAYEALKEAVSIAERLAEREADLNAIMGSHTYDILGDAVFAYAHERRVRLLLTPAETVADVAVKLSEVRIGEMKDCADFEDVFAHIEQDVVILSGRGVGA